MPLVTKSVGSNAGIRSYTTWALAEAATHTANGTDDWIIEGYCDGATFALSEFVITSQVTWSGSTAKSLIVRAAFGYRFCDQPAGSRSRQYDPSKGVAVKNALGGAGQVFWLTSTVEVQFMQFYQENTGVNRCCVTDSTAGSGYRQCMILHNGESAGIDTFKGYAVNCIVVGNCLSFIRIGWPSQSSTKGYRSCTVVRNGALSGGIAPGLQCLGMDTSPYSGVALNVANFNSPVPWGNASTGLPTGPSNWQNTDYNASDGTCPSGTHNQNNLTVTNEYLSTTLGNTDFLKLKAGNHLAGNGTRDQIFTLDIDIWGQARSLTAPTIGAEEFLQTTDVTCTLGAMVMGGLAATVLLGIPTLRYIVARVGGNAIYSNGSDQVSTVVNCTLGAMSLVGLGCSVLNPIAVNCGLGSVTLDGLACSITGGITVDCGVGITTMDGLLAEITSGSGSISAAMTFVISGSQSTFARH